MPVIVSVDDLENPAESTITDSEDHLSWRVTESYYFWSAFAMNVFTAGLFMIAGCFRRSYLSDLSRGQLFCGELSRLFRFKLSLWIMLVLIDFVVFVYIYVMTFQN